MKKIVRHTMIVLYGNFGYQLTLEEISRKDEICSPTDAFATAITYRDRIFFRQTHHEMGFMTVCVDFSLKRVMEDGLMTCLAGFLSQTRHGRRFHDTFVRIFFPKRVMGGSLITTLHGFFPQTCHGRRSHDEFE